MRTGNEHRVHVHVVSHVSGVDVHLAVTDEQLEVLHMLAARSRGTVGVHLKATIVHPLADEPVSWSSSCVCRQEGH